MKRLLTCVLLGSTMLAHAQNAEDALRLGFWEYEGSARYMGMAGAMGALGGDFSVVATNPGGLGRSRRSSISLSPGFLLGRTSTAFRGIGNEEKYSRATVTEGHYLRTWKLDPAEANDWQYLQAGFGYNRLTDFNTNFTYTGQNNTSLLDAFEYQANASGTTPEFIYDDLPFTAGLAYDVYLLDYDTANMEFYSPLTPISQLRQTRNVERKGTVGEWDFAVSGNYDNKIFVGASLGILFGNRKQYIDHVEVVTDSLSDLMRFSYLEDLETSITGFNFKLGMIYEPVPWLKFGASIHTPTRMVMHDEWSSRMSSQFPEKSYSVQDEFVPYGSYDYIVITPTRFTASIGSEWDRRILFGLEAMYTDYSWLKYKPHNRLGDTYDFKPENDAIDSLYGPSVMVRTGLEVRAWKGLLLRGGVAYYSSPYKDGAIEADRMWYTGGMGWRGKNIFFDVALRYNERKESYYQYNPGDPNNLAAMDERRYQVVFTIGGRFGKD